MCKPLSKHFFVSIGHKSYLPHIKLPRCLPLKQKIINNARYQKRARGMFLELFLVCTLFSEHFLILYFVSDKNEKV